MSKTARAMATVGACLTLAMAMVAPSAAATKPGPPTGVSATPGNASATVSWTAPADDGGAVITGYTVTSIPGGQTCGTATLSCTVPGLTNGTAYTFTVTATNSDGTSDPSAPSAPITPRTTPSAPQSVRGTPGNARVDVSWTEPGSNGGAAITSYTATATPGGKTCTATNGLTCRVTGLTNGLSYTFSVVATNAAGNGPASTQSAAVTPRTVPGAPNSVTAAPGNARATVSWTAPTSDGGAAITRYRVDAAPGTRFCATTDSLSCTVTGLSNGQSYTFTVVATNVAGAGTTSAPSNAVTPVTVPSGVRTVTASRTSATEVSISWTEPASTGGTPITGYTVSSNPDGHICSTTGTSCAIGGLTPGTRYTFKVLANNAAGASAAVTSNSVLIPKLKQSAKVRVAKRLKYKGKTVLLKAPVVTSAGQRAKAVASVTPTGKRYANVKKRSGKIIVRAKGVRALRVRLTVTAPATAQYQAFAYSKSWLTTRR